MWIHGHRTCSCGRVSQGASACVFHNALDICMLSNPSTQFLAWIRFYGLLCKGLGFRSHRLSVAFSDD